MSCSGGEGSPSFWLSWAQNWLLCTIAFMAMAILLPAADAAGQQLDFTTDFEDGTLRGWTAEGNAFRAQPTLGDNPTARNRGQAAHLQGKYWIGTYERYQGKPGQKAGEVQGDRPTGTLTSAAFVIPKGTLSFFIGGGTAALRPGSSWSSTILWKAGSGYVMQPGAIAKPCVGSPGI